MNNLLEFIKKYHYWFLFVALETISLVLLFKFNNYQGSVWYTSANDVAAKANSYYGEVQAFVQLRDVNKQLTRQNMLLQGENEALREGIRKLTNDPSTSERHMAEVLQDYIQIEAKVVSKSILQKENYLVIDRGTNDGVRPEMGVVGGGGVVGIVYLAGPHYSLVLPTINLHSNISCRVRGSGYFGPLQWNGGNALVAYMTDVPRYAKIEEGACIETSGFSTVFPPGLFVGRVIRVENAPDGQLLQLKVNLGTDFARLRDVIVVENKARPEVDSLRHHLSDIEAAQR